MAWREEEVSVEGQSRLCHLDQATGDLCVPLFSHL